MTSPLSLSEQRTRDLETLLVWEGAVDNARIREVFGLQLVQASRLVSSFVAEHSGQLLRASPHAPVKPAPGFIPKYSRGLPDDYLHLVESARPAELASFVVDAGIDLSPVKPEIFAVVVQACRASLGVNIVYCSMTQPQGEPQLIFPHSLVRAARRWHIRAWCAARQVYGDYALGRVLAAVMTELPAPALALDDQAWNDICHLVIEPHPELTAEQAMISQLEFLGGQATAVVQVRRALASYVIRDLRLAVDLELEKPPDYLLMLVNSSEYTGSVAVSTQL